MATPESDDGKPLLRQLPDTEVTPALLGLPPEAELLPKDPSYKHPDHYLVRYRKHMLTAVHFYAGCLEYWEKYRARPTDIFVASFPKSGTTWLQEIVWRIVYQEVDLEEHDKPLEYRFPLFDVPAFEGMDMLGMNGMKDPRLMKTHLPYYLLPKDVRDGGAKVLYISRDPRDVCVSYYHFAKMFTPQSYSGAFKEFREKFVEGRVMYGPYREHVRSYLDHQDTVLCLTYEQLHQDRPAVIRRIANFLGREISEEIVDRICQLTDFSVMKKNPAVNFTHWEKTGMAHEEERVGTFMRKGKVGDWTNHFTADEAEEFWRWAAQDVPSPEQGFV